MKEIEVERLVLEIRLGGKREIFSSIEIGRGKRHSYSRSLTWNMKSGNLLVDLKNKGYAYLQDWKLATSDETGDVLYVDGYARNIKFVDSKDELVKELI